MRYIGDAVKLYKGHFVQPVYYKAPCLPNTRFLHCVIYVIYLDQARIKELDNASMSDLDMVYNRY